MSGHIFLSYSRKDKVRAKQLADTFENIGWDVWWDREIPPGQSFDDVIEKALIEASCIVVLWSKNSVKSQWVRTEAAEGKRRRILIPIQIDELDALPLAFRRTQVAPLINWNGSTSSEDFKAIVSFMSPFLPKTNIGIKSATPIAPAAPVTPTINPIKPRVKPARQSAGLSFKSIFAILAAIVLAVIAYKVIDISPRIDPTQGNERIAELEEKQRQLEKELADRKLEDQTKQTEEKRIQQEKELKALQAEKQRLLDLAKEREALAEAKKRAEEANNNNTQQTDPPKGTAPNIGWYVVTASPSLKARLAPKKSGKRIGLIPYGEKIQVVDVASSKQFVAGKSGHWVEIEYKQQRAYVFDAFLRPTGTSDVIIKQDYVVLASPSLTIRKTPDASGHKKGKVKKGKVVTFISKASGLQSVGGKQGYWFKIKYGSTTGYVFSAYLRKK